MKAILLMLALTVTLCVSGCGTESNSITDLREYEINGIHTVVGQGAWDKDGNTFVIHSYDGNTWDVPRTVEILEGPVSLESFQRVTK